MAWLQRVWREEAPPRLDGTDDLVRLIADIAVLGNRSDRYQEGVALFQELGLGGLEAGETAFTLMVRLGEWDSDENLLLHEHGLAEPFSPAALAEAAAAAITPELMVGRTDLRHLHLVSIDDADTRDIDDALSLEPLPDGYRVGIHIADVAAFIPPGTALDEAAKRRSTSIYLPDRKIDMLPARLARDLCSLVAGEDRLAISVLVTFNHTDQVIAHEIVESVIRVRERLSYADVDAMLPERADLRQLQDLSDRLQARRLAAGAVVFSVPELRIHVDVDKTIHLKRIDQVGPSQRLVSELMVLANQLIAEHLQERRIPAIYRSQAAPDEPLALVDGNDPVALARQRRQMKRSEMTLEPKPHFGLGLTVYTQATSPIRRFSDLLMHRQLKQSLRGGPPAYTADELKPLIAMTEQGVSLVNQVQRFSHRYWLLKYLQSQPAQPYRAVVLDVGEDRAQIQLADYLLEAPVYPKLSRRLVPGEWVHVALDGFKPRRGAFTVTLTDQVPSH